MKLGFATETQAAKTFMATPLIGMVMRKSGSCPLPARTRTSRRPLPCHDRAFAARFGRFEVTMDDEVDGIGSSDAGTGGDERKNEAHEEAF